LRAAFLKRCRAFARAWVKVNGKFETPLRNRWWTQAKNSVDWFGRGYDAQGRYRMQMTGERVIAADKAAVWAALLDPAVLKDCVPGCQEMTGNAGDGFEAVVVQKVGPVKATFKGRVVIGNRVEGESLTLTGEGKGGAAGFAKGGADVRLAEAEGGMLLSYDVEAKVGGKLAQLGSRIIDGFAKKMADQFFQSFQERVEGGGEATEDVEEESSEKKGWLSRLRKG